MSRLQMSANFEQIRRPPEQPGTPRPQTPPESLLKRLSLSPGAIVVVGALALGFAFVVSMHTATKSDSAAPAVALAAPALVAPPVDAPAPVPTTASAKIETAEASAPTPAVAPPARVDPITTGTISPKKLKHKPKLKHPKPAAGDE